MDENIKKKRKSENKRFATIGLIVAVAVNLVFRGPLVYSIVELKRYFENGLQPQVLGYFFESFITWLIITVAGFFGPFLMLKAISLESEKSNKEIDERIKKSKEVEKKLSITNKIGNLIGLDDTNKKWVIYDAYGLIKETHNYSDIVSFELLEDGKSVAEGGLKRALVGGVLFGGAGAIVGGITGKKTNEVCNSLKIKVTISNTGFPVTYISLIDSEIKKSNPFVKQAFIFS